MMYSDSYIDFEWRRIEAEAALVDESPLDAMIHREEMRELAESLLSLDKTELICVMMMHYDENEKSRDGVRKYLKNYHGKVASKYKVGKFDKTGLKKARLRLRLVHGWNR
jgi:hypothetical protein